MIENKNNEINTYHTYKYFSYTCPTVWLIQETAQSIDGNLHIHIESMRNVTIYFKITSESKEYKAS